MGVGGQHIFVADAVFIFGNSDPPLHTENQILFITAPISHPGVVKLVPPDLAADLIEWILIFHSHNGVTVPLGPGIKIKGQRQNTNHRIGFSFQNQFFTQIH